MDYKKFINSQLDFFMNNLIDKDKLFIADRYNLISKKKASDENMVNDLGDYIQYLYSADALTGGGYSDDINDLLSCIFDKKSYKNFLKLKKAFLDSTIDKYLNEFYPENLKDFYSLSYKSYQVPVIYWYSIYNDVEELIYIYEYTNDEKYLYKAKELYSFAENYKVNNIPTIASFKNKLFNRAASMFRLNIYNTVLSKTMSNYCSSTIKMAEYDCCIDIQRDVVAPLIDNFYDKKYNRFSTTANNFDYSQYNLGQNHPAISLFVDYDFKTNFDYLSVVNSIIDDAEKYPYHFFESKSFHVDSIVDFSTILLKLFEKEKEEKYLVYAKKYLQYIDKYCRTKFGFYIQGSDRKYIETIYSTKFQSLVLKPYVLLAYMEEGKSIYGDKFVYLMSRDR